MKKHIKYCTKAPEEVEDRVLEFIGSTEDVDRDNEKILASGWKLANYKRNPVVLVNHNPSALPVARTKKVWVDQDNKQLKFQIEFPEPEVSSIGDSLYKLYRGGWMSATSVGFLPNRDKMKWGEKESDPAVTFEEQELLEISLVSIPSNPAAIMTSVSKSLSESKDPVIDEVEMNELEEWLKSVFMFDNHQKDEKNDKDIEVNDKTKENEQENINKDEDKEEMFFKSLYEKLFSGE